MKAIYILVAILISFGCASPMKPLVDANQKLKTEQDSLLQEVSAWDEAQYRWKQKEQALLNKMTDEQIRAYSAFRETLKGNDQAAVNLAYRRLTSTLQSKPSLIIDVKNLFMEAARLEQEQQSLLARANDLKTRQQNLENLAIAVVQERQRRRQEYQQRQAASAASFTQQYNYALFLNELRNINYAIQNQNKGRYIIEK